MSAVGAGTQVGAHCLMLMGGSVRCWMLSRLWGGAGVWTWLSCVSVSEWGACWAAWAQAAFARQNAARPKPEMVLPDPTKKQHGLPLCHALSYKRFVQGQ